MKYSQRKTFILGTLFLAVCLLAPCILFAQERDGVTYDGVTYYLPQDRDKIQLPAEVPEQYTIKTGDTLWGIAGSLLNDNFLWPLLWENNMEQIPNPHLIYPDQVINMPKGGMAIPSQSAQSPSKTFDTAGSVDGQDSGTMFPPLDDGDLTVQEYIASHRIPLAGMSDLEAGGYISKADEHIGSIIANETETLQLATHDIVYINVGENDNVKAGDVFTVFDYSRKVVHPRSKKYLGRLLNVKGRLTVLCTQANTSTAEISKAFDAILVGDKIQAYIPAEYLSRKDRPETDFCNPSSGELNATIVDVKSGGLGISDGVLIGTDAIVYLDMGSDNGVEVGQYFATFSYNDGKFKYQNITNGELVIIGVNNNTATAMVTKAIHPIYIGDTADLK